ncbi:putative bifunctional diguanylate cyclase/phosphodiesterase [Chromatium okenii]|uniref:putative bifunctional diguanylate cyclase/phosphodiesterase n=1 Tax=Chromatium okenii TaxID=61644 RepID=UPI00190396AF|nr:EAL domain-containing protein [Chromatium okenii]
MSPVPSAPAELLPTGEVLLIVDDDTPTRLLLRGVLSRQGFVVIEASDGMEAVALFAQHHPALVLLDVMMPVLDGFATCVQMRALDQDAGTPLIMLTGANDLKAIDHAFSAGATDFITKPINWTLLTQRVRYALRSGQLGREVRRSHLRQLSACRIAKLAFWEWRLSDDSLHWSDDLHAVLGVASPAVGWLGELLALVHPDDRTRAQRLLTLTRQANTPLELELRVHTAGIERLVRLVGERGVQGADQAVVFGAVQDVTALRQTEALVDYLALHDDLTDLPNRRLFLRRSAEVLSTLDLDDDEVLLIIWLDIARFHRHNEALGEAGGDLLLTRLARRLRRLVVVQDALARVGGDEFALLIRAATLAAGLDRLESILVQLRRPFHLHLAADETILTFSVGVAVAPEHGTDPNQLLMLAQDAQRLARSQARAVLVATPLPPSQSRFTETLAVERALHTALERDEFFLVYQPQMELRTGTIVGAEALLRWQHPTLGMVSPVRFIPLLENLGLIATVGQWVLEEACRQAQRWESAGLNLRVGINLSPRQFLEPNLFATIQQVIAKTGVQPAHLELEITESLAMQDPTSAIALLGRLRAIGLKIAIDDFGIGHSSLEYLLRFPIDTIKIDRTFVTNITHAQADRVIVRAVTAIGQTMGLSVIAEGVETLRQCDFIEALGVHEIQGYLIGKPMAAAQLETLIAEFVRPGADLALSD